MENSEKSAFPIPCEQAIGTGLTKREYFSALGMQALVTSPSFQNRDGITKEETVNDYAIRKCKEVVFLADIMLKALEV